LRSSINFHHLRIKEDLMRKIVGFLLLVLIFSLYVNADFDFSKIKERISEFTLPNGLKFILYEDHSVPIASFVTYANVGSSDERIGIYGISHILEHMAFKGTSEVGTKNHKAEKKILEKMDALYDKILAEKNSISPDKTKVKKMEDELKKLRDEADKLVISNEFDSVLKRQGCVGLNAGTGCDSTVYFFSLPSNKIELWAYLESSRFTDPVFREFFKERDVVAEERRVRTENSPIGKLIEELQALAFKDHPYRVSVVGPMSNILNITRRDVRSYFLTNYSAKNLVIGVVGDVYPNQLKKLATKYFSKLNSGRKNSRIFTVEPEQAGEKTLTMYEESQPWLIMGYHCPSMLHDDFYKFSVLNNILTNGRSSRLYKKMVTEDKSALFIGSAAGFPGSKYPSLYIVYTLPNSGHTNEELEKVIMAEIGNLKENLVTEEELKSAKTRLKVSLLRQMKQDQFFLMGLIQSEVIRGSWEKAFDTFGKIEKITVKDINELVKKYLTRNNRVIARIEKKGEDKK
jgi:predicted Zn-dependent peptidase